MPIYKAVMRWDLEYVSSIWSPLASSTSFNKLQIMQNAALSTATLCTQDTNIQHLHDETLILPILRAPTDPYVTIQQKNTTSITPLTQTYNIRQHSKAKTNTIFNNGHYTTNIPTDPHTITTTDIKTNMRNIRYRVSRHLATRYNNKILRTPPPHISRSEEIIPRLTRLTLAQLRTNKSPLPQIIFTQSRRQITSITTIPPLQHSHTHTTHIISSTAPTYAPTLSPLDLWTDPAGVIALLATWT